MKDIPIILLNCLNMSLDVHFLQVLAVYICDGYTIAILESFHHLTLPLFYLSHILGMNQLVDNSLVCISLIHITCHYFFPHKTYFVF